MPLQNRVTPGGEIVVTPERGMFMGNRGHLHNSQQQIVRRFTSYKAWVTCLTEFKNRRRQLMQPKRYTELFFLDEATALAVGHRPCCECRRARYQQFKDAWILGNPENGFASNSRIQSIDEILHAERLTAEGDTKTHPALIGALPDGTLLRRLTEPAIFWLLWRGRLHRWTLAGYVESTEPERDETVDALTPRSIVNALRSGYEPELHGSINEKEA